MDVSDTDDQCRTMRKNAGRSVRLATAALLTVGTIAMAAGAAAADANSVRVHLVGLQEMAPFLPATQQSTAAAEIVNVTGTEIARLDSVVSRIPNAASIDRFILGTNSAVMVIDVATSPTSADVRLTELDRASMVVHDQVDAHSSTLPDGGVLASGTNHYGSPTIAYSPAAPTASCDVCNVVFDAGTVVSIIRCGSGIWAIITCGLTQGAWNYVENQFCSVVDNCHPTGGHQASQSTYTSSCGENYCDVYLATTNGSSSITSIGVDGSWDYPPGAFATSDAGGTASSHHSYTSSASYAFEYNDSPYTAYSVHATSDWPNWTKCSATASFSFGVHWADGSFVSTGYGQPLQKPTRTDCAGWGA